MTLFQTITILICASAIFSYLNHRFLKLPLTIGLMAIALVMSLALVLLGKLGFSVEHEAEAFVRTIEFDEALLHGMLCFLLFAGALHVNLSDLLDQKWVVGTLASVGVLLSTFIIGLSVFALFALAGLSLPLIYCLLFGALISPTDPIAVLSILKEARLSKALEIKIVGESLFNDGVGVVVFLALLNLVPPHEISAAQVTVLFVEEAVGGGLLGLGFGYLAYRMLKSVDRYQVEILITLALVMGTYGLAEVWHTSGPIAVVVAGLLIGNHGRQWAMSDRTREHLDTFWELVDEVLNAILFVLIGLELLVIALRPSYVLAGLIAIPVVLLARLLSVGGPIGLFGLFRQFDRKTVTIMTWGGLRGGISVALALSLPPGESRDALVTITYIVVVFSILVQGLTVGRLVGPERAAQSARA